MAARAVGNTGRHRLWRQAKAAAPDAIGVKNVHVRHLLHTGLDTLWIVRAVQLAAAHSHNRAGARAAPKNPSFTQPATRPIRAEICIRPNQQGVAVFGQEPGAIQGLALFLNELPA